jgi:hypothetical protein
MFDHSFTATDAAIALAAFLLLWYVVGMQIKRRRAVALVRQVRDSIQPLGGSATIRWIGRSAFRVEAEKLTPPLARLSISVLLEPWETFILWAVGRLRGRRDWLMAGVTLDAPVRLRFEVYHPQRRGAFQVSREIRERGWREEPLAGWPPLRCAAPDADGRATAREALNVLGKVDVWRVALSPEVPQLTVSLPVPSSETRVPLPLFAALPHLAQAVLSRTRR